MVLGEITDPTNATKPAKPKSGKTVEQTYQKLTQHEHILQRPDTYVGSIEVNQSDMWTMDAEEGKMKQRKMSYVPGLYKIFDEIMVNAADNKQRDPTMNEIKVDIDRDSGRISVYNNGKGIPVVIHKEHGIYVPELIFGALRTRADQARSALGSATVPALRPSADEQQLRRQPEEGDRRPQRLRCAVTPPPARALPACACNSAVAATVSPATVWAVCAGAKLANIFSTEFVVETADSSNGKRFKQTYRPHVQTSTRRPTPRGLGPCSRRVHRT